MNIEELEQKLCAMLDALAEGAKLSGASRAAGMNRNFIFGAITKSEASDSDFIVSWRDENSRQFCELVPLAQNMGRVRREQHLRGVAVGGQVQYVQDPALLARFGFDDDAKDMAELAGFPDFPFAHDVDGNRIPLLSARHPRPQRQHRPHFPPPSAAGKQSSEAGTGVAQAASSKTVSSKTVSSKAAAGSLPIRDWRPDDPEPPYSRKVRCAAPPPIVNIPTPASPRVMTALEADLRERASRKPTNPRPAMPVHVIRQRADDPPENITGRPTP